MNRAVWLLTAIAFCPSLGMFVGCGSAEDLYQESPLAEVETIGNGWLQGTLETPKPTPTPTEDCPVTDLVCEPTQD